MSLLDEPFVFGSVLVAAAWYSLGALSLARRHGRKIALWRHACFASALVLTIVALDSPLERAADTLFWAHMLQHVLLMMVIAPLFVAAAPWMTFWRPLPLRFRRRAARGVTKSPRLQWLRTSARFIAAPIPAWIAFNGDMALWHVPWLYDLTLRNTTVHYVEHVSFIVFGVLFWAQVIESPPMHSRLSTSGRAIYTAVGSIASWLLAIVLALANKPLYPAYTGHHGLSALGDQQLAAGVMLGPGSIAYAIVFIYWVYVWLDTEEPRARRRVARAPVPSAPQ